MNILVSLALTAISVTAAWLSWHLFEKQVLKLKRYVPYGSKAVTEPIDSGRLTMASNTSALDPRPTHLDAEKT